MRVLLVEDDEMIGQSLKQALGSNGFSVIGCTITWYA